jgi:hypothetical protein
MQNSFIAVKAEVIEQMLVTSPNVPNSWRGASLLLYQAVYA